MSLDAFRSAGVLGVRRQIGTGPRRSPSACSEIWREIGVSVVQDEVNLPHARTARAQSGPIQVGAGAYEVMAYAVMACIGGRQ